MVRSLPGSPDDVASRRKRKLNFSDLRFGCSIYAPKVVKAPSISTEPPPTAKPLGSEGAVVLRRQDERGVVTLTLNRPHAFNALSETMLAELQREFAAIGTRRIFRRDTRWIDRERVLHVRVMRLAIPVQLPAAWNDQIIPRGRIERLSSKRERAAVTIRLVATLSGIAASAG